MLLRHHTRPLTLFFLLDLFLLPASSFFLARTFLTISLPTFPFSSFEEELEDEELELLSELELLDLLMIIPLYGFKIYYRSGGFSNELLSAD